MYHEEEGCLDLANGEKSDRTDTRASGAGARSRRQPSASWTDFAGPTFPRGPAVAAAIAGGSFVTGEGISDLTDHRPPQPWYVEARRANIFGARR
jgi:hypothetical protein